MKKINYDFKSKLDNILNSCKPKGKKYTLKGRNTKLQNKYVFPIIALILVSLGIGFAYVESRLKINGAVEISNSLWDVHFQNLVISDGSMKAVTPATIDQHDPTKITFSIKFSESYSDFYGFTVDVVNNGIVDAKISSAKLDVGNLEGFLDYALTYSDGEEIKENDLLLSKNKDRIRVLLRLKDDADIERMMTVGTQNITLDVQYIQDVEGGTKRPLTGTGPNIIQSLGLTRNAKTSGEINYNEAPTSTSGSGLYYMANSKNDEYPIYFYRGAVDNNNIIFAGLCWKIVRTTEMGGTKLVYNGHQENGQCNATGTATQLSAGGSQFNVASDTPAYIGLMYGKTYNYGSTNFYEYYRPSPSGGYSQYTDSSLTASDISTIVPISTGGYYLHSDIYGVTLSGAGEMPLNQNKEIAHYACGGNKSSTSSIENIDGKNIAYHTRCTTLQYIFYSRSGTYLRYGLLFEEQENINKLEEKMFTNTTDSNALNTLNNWYKGNIADKGLEAYIEDSVWCNDRSIISGDLLSDKAPVSGGLSHFGAWTRVMESVSPTLKDSSTCINENDRFTTKDARYGNSNLKYPIGLLTADEAMLAGQGAFGYATTNENGYLFNGQNFWTMSPSSFLGNATGNAKLFYVTAEGKMSEALATSSYGIRPSVVIKAGVTVSEGGDGTASNPYVIETY